MLPDQIALVVLLPKTKRNQVHEGALRPLCQKLMRNAVPEKGWPFLNVKNADLVERSAFVHAVVDRM